MSTSGLIFFLLGMMLLIVFGVCLEYKSGNQNRSQFNEEDGDDYAEKMNKQFEVEQQ